MRVILATLISIELLFPTHSAGWVATRMRKPSRPLGNTATYLLTDTTTQGAWRSGSYGVDGHAVANDGSTIPAYATLTIAGNQLWTWNTNCGAVCTDNHTNNGTLASCWFGGTPNWSAEITLNDGNSHTISIYFLDYDNNSRVLTVDAKDGDTDALLDTRNVSSFVTGKWLRWTVRGHVKFYFTGVSGGSPNTASAILFDP